MPGRSKSAKVIQTNRVHVSKQSTHPVDRPSISGRVQRIPVVHGISPQLSLCTEVIRRHTGNETRPAVLVQQKQLRICPDVAGIRGSKERQVADQRHSSRMRMRFELIGLAEQQKLRKANLVDLTCQLSTCPR